jgi:uncharacterized protein YraI
MKKHLLPIVTLLLGFTALPAAAQNNDLITLSDAQPSLTAEVALPKNTTGALVLDLSQASITLTDTQGKVVFQEADARVRGVELSIAPNTDRHTLTVQKLPGASAASVRIRSLAWLTDTRVTQQAISDRVGLDQARTLPVTTQPAGVTTRVSLPSGTPGVLNLVYTGITGSLQVQDSAGTLVARADRDIDGINLVLDPGEYNLTLQASQIQKGATATLQVADAAAKGFALLDPPSAPATVNQQPQTQTADCTATVVPQAVRMRVGPGADYQPIGIAGQGQAFMVTGVNPDASWLQVNTNLGGAWVSRDLMQVSGGCNNLPVYSAQPNNFRFGDGDENHFETEHEGGDD